MYCSIRAICLDSGLVFRWTKKLRKHALDILGCSVQVALMISHDGIMINLLPREHMDYGGEYFILFEEAELDFSADHDIFHEGRQVLGTF